MYHVTPVLFSHVIKRILNEDPTDMFVYEINFNGEIFKFATTQLILNYLELRVDSLPKQ